MHVGRIPASCSLRAQDSPLSRSTSSSVVITSASGAGSRHIGLAYRRRSCNPALIVDLPGSHIKLLERPPSTDPRCMDLLRRSHSTNLGLCTAVNRFAELMPLNITLPSSTHARSTRQ